MRGHGHAAPTVKSRLTSPYTPRNCTEGTDHALRVVLWRLECTVAALPLAGAFGVDVVEGVGDAAGATRPYLSAPPSLAHQRALRSAWEWVGRR